jgi:hypothetical protein
MNSSKKAQKTQKMKQWFTKQFHKEVFLAANQKNECHSGAMRSLRDAAAVSAVRPG